MEDLVLILVFFHINTSSRPILGPAQVSWLSEMGPSSLNCFVVSQLFLLFNLFPALLDCVSNGCSQIFLSNFLFLMVFLPGCLCVTTIFQVFFFKILVSQYRCSRKIAVVVVFCVVLLGCITSCSRNSSTK